MNYPIPSESYAVMIANGSPCDIALTRLAVRKADHVVVLDNARFHYKQLGLPYHTLLGDFDKGIPDASEETASVVHLPDQESTDFEKGIAYLEQLGYSHIIILWATGKRTDHNFVNIADLGKYPHLNIELWDNYSRIYYIPNNFIGSFPENTIISLVPLGVVTGVTTDNLFYPLNNEDLALGVRNGNSNRVAESGQIGITYRDGRLLLMECWDEFDLEKFRRKIR